MKRLMPTALLVILSLTSLSAGPLASQGVGNLKVGAARVNVTPPADAALPMSGYAGRDEGFTAIHDSLYYRIVVADDGRSRAAIVVGELIGITEGWWQEITRRIEAEAGIPRPNVILAATHTHAAPTPIERLSNPSERMVAYTREVADRVLAGVLAAQRELQPARIGVGRGEASINVNRIARTPQGGYWLGYNPDGPSDRTVHVVRFESANGEPIAILVNYAVHAVVGGSRNTLISADVAGAISRYVERHYGDRVVVAWTSGAAGDQNPIYRAEGDNLDGGRIPPLTTQGRIVGEEVVRVAEGIARMTPWGEIRGAQRVITVPGKQQDEYSPSGTYAFQRGDPLDIRLSLLMINNVAFAGISGEVLTGIGQRVKRESPYRETIVITHANGASGYLADDRAYETPGYEIGVSRAWRGVETPIVEGLLELMERR